jgi:glutathione reductase (NADPH)
LVIGTGSGAGTVAGRCRAAGWTVAIVDSRPFGGTCELSGCDPKKVLVGAGEVLDWVRRMQGLEADQARIDWPALMRFKLEGRHILRADDVKDTLFAYPTHGSDTQYVL